MGERHENQEKGINMECYYCKGDMKPGKVSHFVKRQGYQLIIDEIPAFVCEQCGEHLFGNHSVDLIQEMTQELDLKIKQSHEIAFAS